MTCFTDAALPHAIGYAQMHSQHSIDSKFSVKNSTKQLERKNVRHAIAGPPKIMEMEERNLFVHVYTVTS